MSIVLKPEQEAWLQARVASGDFASVEEAARRLIDERIFKLGLKGDDLAWAKPLADEGLAALERGEFVAGDAYRRHIDALMASFRR